MFRSLRRYRSRRPSDGDAQTSADNAEQNALSRDSVAANVALVSSSGSIDAPTHDSSGPTWVPDDPRIEQNESHNWLVLACHLIVLRIGWVFKTETVIVPAFLDSIAGAGWMRGCLPLLNRFGQSVPPALFSHPLRSMPRKGPALAWSTLGMAIPMLILAGACFVSQGERVAWLPPLFLFLYVVFFGATGLNLLSFGTVQGKLIGPTRRGRLLGGSSLVGAVAAIAVVLWLLPGWLESSGASFGYIFGFTGVCLAISAASVMALREPRDRGDAPQEGLAAYFAGSWQTLQRDANLRRLILVAMLFSTTLILFPHYQALARERLDLKGLNLMVWVICQTASVGVFSVVLGSLADARGNRLVLRVLIFSAAFIPLLAIGLVHANLQSPAGPFATVFVALGLVPVTLKILANYTQEICETSEHPRYLSTLNLGLALPFCVSPLVGMLIDVTSFELVFLSGAGILVVAGGCTFLLSEPRRSAGKSL